MKILSTPAALIPLAFVTRLFFAGLSGTDLCDQRKPIGSAVRI
jgi:hypothetical protein